MGVHGLWELLAPVGRRVSVETLAGKKLAIDASIWMIQFMKAMRDEKGEMVRNAHILGFFRRICKLLYLRTKPVFVFDGGTPALKRRTVIARRRQRENAQAKIRKTAEKLLLNHLKAMRLKELAADLEKQRQVNDSKGKKPIVQEPCNEQETQKGNDDASISYNQEELDEMLAASIAAEENEHFSIGASTSGAGVPDDEVLEEDDDEDEEMIIPEMHGKVDPAVLAALPPSMQLDLLVQMRERLMAENRQKYQKVKKAPARFSELQIEAYLKTVAFRREIDGVQKSAAGRGIGGVQTSRIASEANREFIFSSSFTGNKGALTSVGQERNGAEESQPPPVNSSTNAVNKAQQTKRSDAAAGSAVTETGRAFHDEVETYLDERGRVRVSRVRALGIRMTRDLQRNLDLMKEIDLEKAERNQEENNESANARKLVDVPDNSSARIQHREATDKNDGMNTEVDKTEEPAVANGASIEISFEDTSEHREYDDNDDELFAHLVAGEPVMDFSFDKSATSKQSFHSSSDNEWEEGVIEGKSTDYLSEGGTNDEGEVEWEEGFRDIQLKSSSCPDESRKTVTKGALEEEAAFQEAIRRSLEDTRVHRSMDDLDENQTSERTREMVIHNTDCVSICEGKEWPDVETLGKVASQSFGSMDNIDANCAEAKSVAFMELNLDKSKLDLKLLNQDIGESGALAGEILVASGTLPGAEGLHMTEKQPLETYSKDGNGLVMGTYCEKVAHNCRSSAFSSAFTDSLHERLLDSHSADAQCMSEAELDDHFSNTEKPGRTSADDSVTDVDGTKELAKDKIDDNFMIENLSNDRLLDSGSADAVQMIQAELDDHFCNTEKPGKISADDSVTDVDGTNELAKDKLDDNFPMEKDEVMRNDIEEHEIMEDHLEEEMLFLGKEREELGTEQRKLERDAESVSNEMFAECQELLQMFGLPYIIAPMEAEAQCAFMELSNLVDGVVTDDSDAFLFGAQSVYKNIFDDRKYVETYLMKDIENELGLDQEKLIHMALLLGSDYTEGISGVGIVNAIEVVNAFPGKEGLREFREWIESPDPSILGKLDIETGGNSRKKGSKGTENIMSGSSSSVEGISFDEMGPQLVDDAKRRKQIFMDKHRNVSKNWHISPSFPSDAVISAYASPQVDKSTEPFSWGKPDLFALRKLCWEKFGWGASKADELLLPVLKEYNKHETQLRLEAFYTFNERFAKIRSKRIKKAVKGITGSKSSALMDETPEQSRSGKKRKVKPFEDEGNQSGVDSTRLDGAGSNGQGNTMEKPTVKQSKRGQTKEKNSQRKESHEGGRHRGRGRRQPSGRGRRKNNSYADTETGYDDASCSENDEEMQFHISDEARQVRRSGRLRKTVNYTVSDEFDNSEESENFLEEGLVQTDSFVGEEVGGIDKSNMNSVNEGSEVRRRNGALVGVPERTQRTDKMSTGLIDDGEMDDPSDQGQASKDNLQFGGGLCLDEGSNVRTGGGSLVEETEQTHRMDKMSTGLIDDCEVDDPSNQGQASKDYLQFGGGFCLDEDEEKEFDGHASSPIRKTIPNEFNILTGADSVVDENRGSNPSTPRRFTGEMILSDNEQSMNDKTSRSDYSSPDRYNAENELENRNPKFLRAMPNLIRKRRKN